MKIHQHLKAFRHRLEQGPDHWRWYDIVVLALLIILGANLLGFAASHAVLWLAAHHLLPATLYVLGIGAACFLLYWLSGKRPPPGQQPGKGEKN